MVEGVAISRRDRARILEVMSNWVVSVGWVVLERVVAIWSMMMVLYCRGSVEAESDWPIGGLGLGFLSGYLIETLNYRAFIDGILSYCYEELNSVRWYSIDGGFIFIIGCLEWSLPSGVVIYQGNPSGD